MGQGSGSRTVVQDLMVAATAGGTTITGAFRRLTDFFFNLSCITLVIASAGSYGGGAWLQPASLTTASSGRTKWRFSSSPERFSYRWRLCRRGVATHELKLLICSFPSALSDRWLWRTLPRTSPFPRSCGDAAIRSRDGGGDCSDRPVSGIALLPPGLMRALALANVRSPRANCSVIGAACGGIEAGARRN